VTDTIFEATYKRRRKTMLKYVVWVIFNAVAIIGAIGTAVWLTITGHTMQIGGLLLAMGGVLAAVLLGFRVAEGYGPGELSIWVGPSRSLEEERSVEAPAALRQAA
jgi:hypothetical protein